MNLWLPVSMILDHCNKSVSIPSQNYVLKKYYALNNEQHLVTSFYNNIIIVTQIIIHIIIGELPVTIDFNRFDRAPGDHNITIVANSTLGEMAEFTSTFFVPGAL